jgi:molecular chaperone DnaJ
MSQKADYYQTLGVAKNAAEQDIKKAYRKLAMQYHPDRNPGNKEAEAKFKEVQEAYDVIADPQKRAAYDQYGHAAFEGGMGGGGFSQGFDMGDIFGDMFEGTAFESFFGGAGGAKRKNRPRRGSDMQYQMDLTFEQAVFGHKTEISIPRTDECGDCLGKGAVNPSDIETCPICRGSGQIQRTQGIFSVATTCHHCGGQGSIIKNPCKSCQGKGRIKKSSKISVSIPAGVDDGFRIKLRREGESGENGGPSGDLYLLIRVKEHEFFKREGNDVLLTQSLSFTQAALGCSIKVPTLSGSVKLTVPEGTASGKVFRLRGEGVMDVHGHGKGDQLVQIQVETPKSLTSEQKKLLREFAKLRGEEAEEQDFLGRVTEKVKDIFG